MFRSPCHGLYVGRGASPAFHEFQVRAGDAVLGAHAQDFAEMRRGFGGSSELKTAEAGVVAGLEMGGIEPQGFEKSTFSVGEASAFVEHESEVIMGVVQGGPEL